MRNIHAARPTDSTNRTIGVDAIRQKDDLSTLSLAVLGLISQRPLTGYDLRKVFATTPMGHFSSSPGAIYPALTRIEEAGWIHAVPAGDRTRRPRVVYEITSRGRKVRKEHLSQPVTSEDVTWRMDDLMMRFAFMDDVVGRAGTMRFLQDFAARIDAHVTELRCYFEGARGLLPPCGRLATEYGIQSYWLAPTRLVLHNLEILVDSMVYALALVWLLVPEGKAKADESFARFPLCLEQATIEK